MASLETIEVLLKELKCQNDKDHEELKCQNEKAHEIIIHHQEITNGRVNKLEAWKNKVMGALVIMNIVFVPVLLALILNVFKDK